MTTLTKTQARKIAGILTAYADGKIIQWKPDCGTGSGRKWEDGKIKASPKTKAWLKSHRIKPNQ